MTQREILFYVCANKKEALRDSQYPRTQVGIEFADYYEQRGDNLNSYGLTRS